MKTKCINGWTKASIIKHITDNFHGKSVTGIDNSHHLVNVCKILSIEETCAYRGDFGAKCAMGMFIPDNRYSPEMEGRNANKVIKNYKLEKYMPLQNMAQFQSAHDSAIASDCLQAMIHYIEEEVED